MSCTECGFRFDPDNESQVACPCCGTDPTDPLRPDAESDLGAAFEDGEALMLALTEGPILVAGNRLVN